MDKFKDDYYRIMGVKYWGKVPPISIFFKPRLLYLFLARLAERPRLGGKVFKVIQRAYGRRYGLEFSSKNIQSGMAMGHAFCITINDSCKIGRNFSIHKGATIGQTARGSRVGVPTIGSEVWVGVNATIVGNVTIGDDVLIAPNAYVNFDVPSHAVVVGNPGVITMKANATEGYITNKVGVPNLDS